MGNNVTTTSLLSPQDANYEVIQTSLSSTRNKNLNHYDDSTTDDTIALTEETASSEQTNDHHQSQQQLKHGGDEEEENDDDHDDDGDRKKWKFWERIKAKLKKLAQPFHINNSTSTNNNETNSNDIDDNSKSNGYTTDMIVNRDSKAVTNCPIHCEQQHDHGHDQQQQQYAPYRKQKNMGITARRPRCTAVVNGAAGSPSGQQQKESKTLVFNPRTAESLGLIDHNFKSISNRDYTVVSMD